jgi:hypothetical protein
VPLDFIEIENLYNVGVAQAGDHFCLSTEAFEQQ